jgi:hypothetical protein
MATTTINGITFEVSISEMLELANGAVKAARVSRVDNSHAEKATEAIVEKAKRNSDNSGTKTLACGHSVPVSRGRYPNKCADCADTVENTPKKAEKRSSEGSKRNGRGYRRFNRDGDDSWKDNPASEAQVERILHGQKKADGSVRRARRIVMRLLLKSRQASPLVGRASFGQR